MRLTLQWDRSLTDGFGRDVQRAVLRAVSKAGGDALRGMRAASSRSIRSKKRIRAGRVTRGLPLHFPRGARELDALEWRMDVLGTPAPVASYPFRATRRGVNVAINKGARALIPGAFVATMKSGHVGIFQRRGKARLPIDPLLTTRISDVFADSGMIPDVQARTQERFAASFARLFPLELAKVR